jgi:hypothetical protein
LKFALRDRSAHQARTCSEIEPVAAQVSASDCNAQLRISGLIDPADRRCIATPFKRFKGLQPMHGLASW